VEVYNFTVAIDHSYFVAAQGIPDAVDAIWVHNSCPKGGTYVLRDGEDVVRTGRTKDLARRKLEHARNPAFSKYDFEIVHQTDVYAEQRGLEEVLNKKYKAPLDKIRAISLLNPNRRDYINAAKKFLEALKDTV
jgi:hypothetical protein